MYGDVEFFCDYNVLTGAGSSSKVSCTGSIHLIYYHGWKVSSANFIRSTPGTKLIGAKHSVCKAYDAED